VIFLPGIFKLNLINLQMAQKNQIQSEDSVMGRTLNVLIKIGLILGLIVLCFLIVRPFLMMTLWGVIISVTVYPLYCWLKQKLGNRTKLASSLVTLLVLLVILIPFGLMAGTFIEGIGSLRSVMAGEKFFIPLPSESVKGWPLIGDSIYQFWYSASQNIEPLIKQYMPQIKEFMVWFLGAAKNTGVEFIKLIASIIISGVLLAYSETGGRFIRELFIRLAGNKGNELFDGAEKTIRNVSLGIVGVALIQSVLLGIGFLVAGVPGAGLWALISLFLGIIQIGVFPVTILVMIYMFITAPTLTAVLLLTWCIIVSPLDNILKPLLLGRGSKSPMLVIFLGAIGGFLLSGLIGLFFGAVILSLGYNLFLTWLKESKAE
jgi:predicted PurR-regulated permease PerM